MQSTSNSVKIYNAVYSSVQVYECMVRNIAVMRRRADSYVNATQILKVAGVDKGRRTKILEKEILPGKHEIVQGGYGKYQGTWIPLERGRDIAQQYGVGPLLAPLFDFIPSTSSLGPLPLSAPIGSAAPRPLSAASSYGSLPGSQPHYMPPGLAPPPIMPGSALRLLNQGRAQGLFTPSTSHLQAGYASPIYGPPPTFPHSSQTPPPNALKRTRSDVTDIVDVGAGPTEAETRPASVASQSNGDALPSPAKRARTEATPQPIQPASSVVLPAAPAAAANGTSRSASPKPTNGTETAIAYPTRASSKPSIPRSIDPTAPIRDPRRTAVIAAICQSDDPHAVQDVLRELSPDAATAPAAANGNGTSPPLDIDTILDDQGHTALHIAASLAHLRTVAALIVAGADINRGNHLGETPLMRACLATHSFDTQTFENLVTTLSASIRTLDTSRKSVLHHVTALAGVKGRAAMARYYLDKIFYFIVQNQGGDFTTLIDLQDEHGDTALNIAARVGNRSMVRTLLDVGANRNLGNKLGLRPADFGVEIEQDGTRPDDRLAALRSGPPPPVQKSQDVIADLTVMIQSLSNDFQAEIKLKQDALDVTQAHLRAATRELSEQRKQIQAWQSRCGELDQVQQRIRNIEKALIEEDEFDWTGRSNGSGDPDAEGEVEDDAIAGEVENENNGGPAFQWRGTTTTGDVDMALVRLRRLKLWHARMEDLMKARLKGLQGASAEKEYQSKKIIALSTQLPIDKVEDMLETLLVAVESESQVIDLSRVSGFMQKVRDGII
ncbi:Transcriptional factor [Mycena chlorophos]|uniref:Transcriptional factor n=1 Tax=Mycena chlorophos TaxID=658473 RepID=A0A8H6T087_MYCCL|nr:Transcriptional factor [Mycena chlorophos]